MSPMEIEQASMAIIESELQVQVPEEIRPIVLRAIHATADFSFAETLTFTPGVIKVMQHLLTRGCTVITDTNMALAGINKSALTRLGARACCFMASPEVAEKAQASGQTRAWLSMEHALTLPGPQLLVCGNAPTFLLSLLSRLDQNRSMADDLAVIGVPVGFVNVVEAKEQLLTSGLPCIVSRGRRGGSTVASAIVNALMYGIPGVRS